jgi:uncharacterized protein DUF4386
MSGWRATPRARARIAGAVYLFFFATAVLGEGFLRQAGVSGLGAIPGDAASTAENILANEAMYRLGTALALISIASYAILMALFFRLFRHVHASLALVATILGAIGCGVSAAGSLLQAAPLVILGGDSYLNAFDAQQLQALALLALKLNAQAVQIALVFFGLFQIAIGYVIARATFLPRILGLFVAAAGVGWLTVLVPPLVSFLGTPLQVFGFIAEASLMLWLLVFGVNSHRWNEQARVAS